MRIPTIGLEIHIELKTQTKMFCGCPNDPEERHPNTNVCPICLAHPGTLPTINKDAILKVLKVGLALKGKIAKDSHFDRKSYFYPDLPKGYQISQYEKPLVEGGILNDVRIRRVHLEEDTGRLIHSEDGTASLVDFNRAGIPLMELVSEPDIKNAEEAVAFAKELQLILRYLGVSNADMEKGQMRVEANISLNQGTKVEIKNINSFKAVHDAIQYELKRQAEILEKGELVRQETRGWDEKKGVTVSQRSKESAHDYRYFPEPDLPPLDLSEFDLAVLRAELPELPEAKRHRFVQEFGLGRDQIEVLVEDEDTAGYFEEAVSEFKAQVPEQKNLQILYNYFTSDLRGLIKEQALAISEIKITPEHFAHLVVLIDSGKISSRLAKDLMQKMFESGEDPETIMQESGTRLIGGEEELKAIIEEIIKNNPKAVGDYKKGKGNALQFLIGQAMAKTKGQASPQKLEELFQEHLKH